MPYIKMQTNVEAADRTELLKKLSSALSAELGKSEAYIMTAYEFLETMTLGGDSASLAFIECKSIGLKKDQTAGLSSVLCTFCNKEMGIPGDRVYIEFSSAEGPMWGWNGKTF